MDRRQDTERRLKELEHLTKFHGTILMKSAQALQHIARDPCLTDKTRADVQRILDYLAGARP